MSAAMPDTLDLQTEALPVQYGEPIAHDYYIPPPPRTISRDDDDDEGDIYRGEPPSPPRSPSPESISSTSSSTSSSSSSSVFGGRLGAISTLVEHAIARWARGRDSSDSLSTTSSTSSTSSIVTVSRSYLSRRRRRRPSLADTHNARSEREVAARIRAREEARQVSREFVLYVPSTAGTAGRPRLRTSGVRDESGVLRTTSMQLILNELNVALKKNMKTRRAQDFARASAAQPHVLGPQVKRQDEMAALPHNDYMIPDAEEAHHHRHRDNAAGEDMRGRRRARKGKQRVVHEDAQDGPTAPTPPGLSRTPSDSEVDKAWWLDVSSPTWEDMRAIGRLLHLHPLTLEDILQQDPREKLELFPKLGYYFVVFRAIESQKVRDRRRLMSTVATDRPPTLSDEGIIGEVNVYLVIFREGIISFHFSDISEHTDAVRSKVLMYAQSGTVTMSSDWIAHGIMDSIVDSFFPFLEEVEKEAASIEDLVFSDEEELEVAQSKINPTRSRSSGSDTISSDDTPVYEKSGSGSLTDKLEHDYPPSTERAPRTHFSMPRYPVFSARRFRQFFRWLRLTLRMDSMRVTTPQSTLSAATGIQRIARMRRLVTSLTRVLATKSEVVASVKKRLLMTGESGLGNGTVDDQDVFVYMGDVQDHILTLQQSLAHYERMLGQSHPTYLTHLRMSASKAKSGTDKAIFILSTISMGVLVVQAVIGFNSMNVRLPRSKNFQNFGIVIAISCAFLFAYVAILRYWWVRAKNKPRQF